MEGKPSAMQLEVANAQRQWTWSPRERLLFWDGKGKDNSRRQANRSPSLAFEA